MVPERLAAMDVGEMYLDHGQLRRIERVEDGHRGVGIGTGIDYDAGIGIAVDSLGNALVTGSTNSSTFPVLNAQQGTFGGDYDAFVTKLHPSGSSLVYSTYVGGSGREFGRGIAVDPGEAGLDDGGKDNSGPGNNNAGDNGNGTLVDTVENALNGLLNRSGKK